ncbi:MAG: TRAP transporter small permease [Halanaerobiales bacterium]|nr:TRAP transporter small permease [Halanaerobiales bacterium]
MQIYEKIIKNICRYLASIGAVCLLIIMFAINLDVGGRVIFNRPIYGTLGTIRTLLIFLIFLSVGFTQVRKAHIRVEFLLKKFNIKARRVIIILGLIYDFIIIGMLSYGSYLVAYRSFITRETLSGIINYPVWPGRYAVAFGLMLLMLQYSVDIYNFMRDLKK